MNENENLLLQVTTALKNDLIHSMQSKGRYASGATVAALETPTSDSRSQLLAPDWIDTLEKGRKPTSPGAAPADPTLFERIKVWCSIKGIDQKAAWAITQKIHRDGYAGTPGVLTEPLSDENVDRHLNEIMDKVALLARAELAKSLAI